MTRHMVHLGRILLKNSVFGQLDAFHRETVPQAYHSENVFCQRRAHKTLVLISGSVFPAGEFFNRIGGFRTFVALFCEQLLIEFSWGRLQAHE